VAVTFNGNKVSSDYFKVMKIAIVQGREFSSDDTPGSPSGAILNEGRETLR